MSAFRFAVLVRFAALLASFHFTPAPLHQERVEGRYVGAPVHWVGYPLESVEQMYDKVKGFRAEDIGEQFGVDW